MPTTIPTQPTLRRHDARRPEIIVRKPVHQLDPSRSKRWMRGDATTLLCHALSPTFPGGETFFIKSVMHFRDQIDDPQLSEEMRRFAAQEAVHTREHLAYDAAVQEHYDLKEVEDFCRRDLRQTFVWLRSLRKSWFNGPRFALAITVALEHITATLGHQVLSDDRIMEGVEPEFAKLWRWHAAEEIEHKAVAYDVFQAVGGNWFERCAALVIMTTLLSFDTTRLVLRFLRKDGDTLAGTLSILKFLWVSPGILRNSFLHYLDFYRPGFHPWNHDDRDLLARWQDGVGAGVGAAVAATV